MKARVLRRLVAVAVAVCLFGLIGIMTGIPGWNGSIPRFTGLLCAVALSLLATDLTFRLRIRLRRGRPYKKNPPLPFEDLYTIPHPYFPWIYRPHAVTGNQGFIPYPLHYGQFSGAPTRASTWGYVDGPEADRDITQHKSPGEYRIACVGASTTGNYIKSSEGVFSYPSELERILRSDGFSNMTVINCGVGGYNSGDLLVRFALQTVDLEPDCIIIYHAYNDIRAYLTPGLTGDFAHSRRSLAEVNWKLYAADAMPTFGLASLDYIRAKYLAGSVGKSLLELTTRGVIDLTLDPAPGLAIYRRNLQSIIDLAESRDIRVVLSTYCHFLHKEIENDTVHLRYHDIVAMENQIMRDLAEKNNLLLTDNATAVPLSDPYFVDSIHFTPAGMVKVAENFADTVKPFLLDGPIR